LSRAGLAFAAGLLCAGCAGPPAGARPDAASPAGAPVAPIAQAGPPVEVVAPQVAPAPAYGPAILLPDAAATDDVVVRIGDLALRKSHAYTRLLSADPKLALSAVDLLVFDVLVARHAQEHGITVKPERVEELATAEEQDLNKQVQSEFGTSMSVADYVWRIFGMRLPDWRASLRLRTAQRLYQGYVIRYLGLREDRVQVRYIVHKDKKVVDEIYDKVRAGADFATLALRWSEDNYRRDGGLLPSFGRGFPHPVAETAFALQKGEVSKPFSAHVGDVERWFVVFCLDRVVGRTVSFEQVRDEIDRELQNHPVAPIEMSAYTLRWRAAFEKVEEPATGK
jgi:parvulin-like peptidyl-prolyl isomerase